jgi:hypothetical protein
MVAGTSGRRLDRPRHGRDRRVRYPGGALSRGVGLDKDDMIQALGLSFTVSTIENLAHAQVAHDLLDAGGGGAVFAASTRLKPPTECAS